MQSVNANQQPLRLVSFPLSLEAGSANQEARWLKLGFRESWVTSSSCLEDYSADEKLGS